MLSLRGGQCAPLVEAIISKYVALAPEELEEWREDPESYVRCEQCGRLCVCGGARSGEPGELRQV